MKRVAKKQDREETEAIESIKRLLRAGAELGVAEAVRRIAQLAPARSPGAKKAEIGALLGSASLVELVQFVRNDPGSVFHLAKEVWSRGGPKDKRRAVDAIGRGLGYFVPHRALDAAKELASMARSGREADLVGRKAIGPVLERAPGLFDRVKGFVNENERLLRQAAIAGLVGYVARKRKFAALGVEVLLLVAEEHEKDIRSAVRYGLKRMMAVDPKATARTVVGWVRENPTAERVQAAASLLARRAGDVRLAVERGVIGTLARLDGARTAKGPPTASAGKARKRTPRSRPRRSGPE